MSDPRRLVGRYFTLVLPPHERSVLEALAAHTERSLSDALRYALRYAAQKHGVQVVDVREESQDGATQPDAD